METGIKHKKYILFLIALTGFIVSIQLAWIYFKVNFFADAEPSFCTVNEFIDCDAVAKTVYAVFLGVPQAVYGTGFYLFLTGLALFPFNKFKFFKNFKNPDSYIFTLATLAVIYSASLWIILSFIVHKVCLLCYVLYAVNILLMIVSKSGKPALERYKESFGDFISIISDKVWLFIVASGVVFIIAALIAINVTGIFMSPLDKISTPPKIETRTQKYKATGNILGAKNPKLIIHEYTDFECPFCSISNSMLIRLVNETEGVMVVHHDFPLNKDCNGLIKKNVHKFACKAACYSRAAKKQGKYWDYITLLFNNQRELSDSKFIEFAESLNLDINRFKKDAASPEIKKAVKRDIESAKNFGINGTPTYIIGIKKHEGIMKYSDLKALVNENL